jgi:hypothetical protein
MFLDQMPTYLVFKKVHFLLASKFSSLPHGVTIFKNEKVKFKVALRKYLNALSFTL